MLEQFISIYADMRPMMKNLKKRAYEANMEVFRRTHGHYFDEMITCVEAAADPSVAEKEIAENLVMQVKEHYAKKGKVPAPVQSDLNMFMVYYVFPAILLTKVSCAESLCQRICDVWGATFIDSKIGYTSYEKLYGSFREKIFGIF